MTWRTLAIATTIGIGSLALATNVSAATKVCKNGVCSRTTFDGRRVNAYLTYQRSALLGTATHYNFRGEFGEQIEIGGFYSFIARKGSTGRFRAQACYRNAAGVSRCTAWSTFDWRAR
jgi:hypothetical protein